MTRLARRVAARPWPENRRLIAAAISLVAARLSLRLPFRWLITLLHLAPGQTPDHEDSPTLAEAQAIGFAVQVAAARLPGTSTCLAQAMAASALLRHRGIATTLYLGVAKNGATPEGMAAHAWLRCGGVLLTGGEIHERFSPVASYASRPRLRDE